MVNEELFVIGDPPTSITLLNRITNSLIKSRDSGSLPEPLLISRVVNCFGISNSIQRENVQAHGIRSAAKTINKQNIFYIQQMEQI
jgi:uncharacterized protein YmfQ (DUF2313 family)